ncbi:MAG: CARDB domain-containing protein [Bacteroidota bacterium]
MKKVFLLLIFVNILWLQSCEDCQVNPDLISQLAAQTVQPIVGEPIDWEYVIESVDNNTQDCKVGNALASIGGIIFDFFTDESDGTGNITYSAMDNIPELGSGDSERSFHNVVLDSMGIYMIGVSADITNVVEERNESNNDDIGTEDTRAVYDLFPNASLEFEEKFKKASAIIIAKRDNNLTHISSYKGKPIYHAIFK